MNKTDIYSIASVQMIGFSNQYKDGIDTINALGYDGLKAELYSDEKPMIPTEEDRMVILLGSPNSERVRNVAKTFYEADVLTLVVLNRYEQIPTDCIDAFTIARQVDIVNVVKALVEPIFKPCSIAYDFNDLRLTLAKSKHFLVLTGEGKGKNRIEKAIMQATEGLDKEQLRATERMAFILYYANEDPQPLTVAEMSDVSEFIGTLPVSTEAIWALYKDEDLPPTGIRISIIASGKELKI